MTAPQEWVRLTTRARALRHTAPFVVERPDRRAPDQAAIGTPLRLQITEELEGELLKRTRERIAALSESSILDYDRGHRPEPGEVVAVRIDEIDGLRELRNAVVSGDIPPYAGENANRRRLLLYGVALGRGADAVVCIQKFSPRQILQTDTILYFVSDHSVYGGLSEDGFAFDLDFDLFLSSDYAFAVNREVLERVMGYLEEVRAEAKAHATQLVQHLPLANPGEFVEACARDMRFARKVADIVSRPGFVRITVADLVRHAASHNIVLPQSATGELMFSNAAGERWILLKLLDDDYLDSLLTGTKYEVNSKRSH